MSNDTITPKDYAERIETLLKLPKRRVSNRIYNALGRKERKRIFMMGMNDIAKEKEVLFALLLLRTLVAEDKKERAKAKVEEAVKKAAAAEAAEHMIAEPALDTE